MGKQELSKLEQRILDAYIRKTPKSKQLFDRARESIEGGVYSAVQATQPYPIYMTHGRGSKTYDVDGNEYLDCNLNAGPTLLGHCHPEVTEAVKRVIDRGLLISHPAFGIECAELLREIIPCAEKVTFSSTGSEINIYAVRVARAFTGKNKIIKFYGQYAGVDDQFLVGLHSFSDEIVSSGVPKESVVNTVLLKFNDIDAVKRKLAEDSDIAGIIVEPCVSMGGIFPPSREYLTELRQLTREYGVVLIFDEVITGFRLAPGGAQEYFGVTPDLATFSKAIASGAKLSALAGRTEIMNALLPGEGRKAAFHGGTFNTGTIALAAAIATLKVYKRLGKSGEYQRLFQRAENLKAGIEMIFRKRGVPCHINMLGPYLKVFFTDVKPSFEAYCELDPTVPDLFFLSLIPQGIWPYVRRSILLSFAHTDGDIEKITGAINSSFDEYGF
ncbi:aspartate aminotransferase family protein [Chloroflexota bacterium]